MTHKLQLSVISYHMKSKNKQSRMASEQEKMDKGDVEARVSKKCEDRQRNKMRLWRGREKGVCLCVRCVFAHLNVGMVLRAFFFTRFLCAKVSSTIHL